MNANKLFLVLILACLFGSSNAQLRVLSNGRVQAGLLRDVNEDLGNVTQLQIFGRIGDYRSGSKLSFGDFGQYANQGWNVFVGEYGDNDTDQLWLHGKLGTYFTSNGYGTNVIAYYNPSINSSFVFNTNLRVNGVTVTSDARLKENVKSLQNASGILGKLNGVSYNYSLSEVQKNRKQEESMSLVSSASASSSALSSVSSAKENDLSGVVSESAFETVDAAKTSKNNLVQAKIDKREAEDANRRRIGFLAQDIQKVLPDLVLTDENGVLSIDYIGFIPLIVESLKEMQQTIDEQSRQIENLQNLQVVETRSASATANSSQISTDNARLYNIEGASVGYSLPAVFASANLQIFDITGRLVKKMELDNSRTVAEVSSNETGYGTFVYTLFVDGQKRDVLKKYINR